MDAVTRFYQLDLQVRYSASICASRRVLRVLPLEREGQIARHLRIQIAPAPHSQIEKCERYGTRALVLAHRKIETCFDFRLQFEGETLGAATRENQISGVWRMPSRGVDFGGELSEIARRFKSLSPPHRALQIARFCFENLSYTPQNSPQPPSASEIWQFKRGSCADFAHVFLALARQSALPARYVSGFGTQNGALHAWVEAHFEGAWHAFDPTLGREISPGYFALAVGRDFWDCAPHLGAFSGVASAELKLWCESNPIGRAR